MSNSRIIFMAALAGVGIGMLIAPKKGSELQRSILDSIDEAGHELGEIKEKAIGVVDKIKAQVQNIKSEVTSKVEHVKEGVQDLKTTAEHAKQVFS